jgi:hypothetical protein
MIDEIVKETHEGLNLNKINDNLYLTNKEIEVLDRYDIDYHTSIEELMFNLDEILNENDYEDLEEVSNSIAEFNYYHNTKK